MRNPHFVFLTLFPQAIETWLTTSILGRAGNRGLFSYEMWQLRDFATDPYRSVDDRPFGGGKGMVLRLEPLVAATEKARQEFSPDPVHVIYFSPCGRRLDTGLLEEMETLPARHFLLVCGHYEGVDQRYLDHWVDQQVSLGDFVLTGGELPAVALVDALIRRLPETLAEDSFREESFSIRHPETGDRLLEYPHYTRPAEFRGLRVPEVLTSGDHARISAWRKEQMRKLTK